MALAVGSAMTGGRTSALVMGASPPGVTVGTVGMLDLWLGMKLWLAPAGRSSRCPGSEADRPEIDSYSE